MVKYSNLTYASEIVTKKVELDMIFYPILFALAKYISATSHRIQGPPMQGCTESRINIEDWNSWDQMIERGRESRDTGPNL